MTAYVIGPNGPGNGSALTAIQQPARPYPAITIYNTGAATVYLGDDPPLNPTDGIPLSAGSVIPWDADQALYAVCPTSTTISTSSNTGVPFDAGAVAAQILDQGLATDIANAISITGAPPIDTNKLLVTLQNLINGTGPSSALIDVSSYQSINIAATALADPSINVRVDVNWCDSTGVVIFRENFFVGTGGATDIAMSVRGPRVYFSIIILGVGAPAVIKVYGSYKAIASNFAQLTGYGEMGNGQIDALAGYGFQTWYGSIPVSTTWVAQMDHIAGPCRVTMRFTTTNTAGYTRLVRIPNPIFSLTTYLAETAVPTVSGDMRYDDILLPPVPLEISLANTSATQTLNFRATLVYGRPFSA